MAPQRILQIGDPVQLPSGKRARLMVTAIPNRPWIAVQFEGQWAVRREHDAASYAGQEEDYDIAVVSGLYELFSDNDKVLASLRGVMSSLKPGGYLIYTAQPWPC